MEQKQPMSLLLRIERKLTDELRDCNALTARYGLTLSESAIAALAQKRITALADSGRVEFAESAITKLIKAFCDSPYLQKDDYEETLYELTDAFYAYKNDTFDRMSDDELIGCMRACYDAYAGGLDAVTGMTLSSLCGGRRLDEIADEEPDEETGEELD